MAKIHELNTDIAHKQQNKPRKKRSILQCDTLETHEDKVKRIAQEFNAWAADIRKREQFKEKKWAYRMSDFKREKGIQYGQWKQWYFKNTEGFADTVVDGKEYLGTHLWAGAAEGSLTSQFILRDLHHYSEEFRENDSYEDKRKREQNAELVGIANVILEAARNVDPDGTNTPKDPKAS
jgi:hypothetical protein